MPTVSYTWTFDAGPENWFAFGAGIEQRVITDGDPGIGCWEMSEFTNASEPGGFGGSGAIDHPLHGTTWETLGVPAGQVVTDVTAEVHFKKVSIDASVTSAQLVLDIARLDILSFMQINLGDAISFSTGVWVVRSASSPVIWSLQNSAQEFAVKFNLVLHSGVRLDGMVARVDNIKLTITYGSDTSIPTELFRPHRPSIGRVGNRGVARW